ncbi:hypothetical protein GCM10022232_87250 [Streptomyces plumbiresistens]|uniref:Uncharacterized protein n=1 Tax=Streptomyces plumbiresistens TaxID=511811 RepID=A0ABP7TLP4_9ACTN
MCDPSRNAGRSGCRAAVRTRNSARFAMTASTNSPLKSVVHVGAIVLRTTADAYGPRDTITRP